MKSGRQLATLCTAAMPISPPLEHTPSTAVVPTGIALELFFFRAFHNTTTFGTQHVLPPLLRSHAAPCRLLSCHAVALPPYHCLCLRNPRLLFILFYYFFSFLFFFFKRTKWLPSSGSRAATRAAAGRCGRRGSTRHGAMPAARRPRQRPRRLEPWSQCAGLWRSADTNGRAVQLRGGLGGVVCCGCSFGPWLLSLACLSDMLALTIRCSFVLISCLLFFLPFPFFFLVFSTTWSRSIGTSWRHGGHGC